MARFRLPLIIAVIVSGAFIVAQAGIDNDGGDRDMLKAWADSGSTFEIQKITGVFPLDTVDVAVYFHSDSTAGYIQNRITWEATELTLLDVIEGPGIPATATLDFTIGADSVHYTIYNAVEFGVPAGEPITYLRFAVQCYGYGLESDISFIDGDDVNYYNKNNISYAPLRVDGYVKTSHDSPMTQIAYLDYTRAYPGEQQIAMEFFFYQASPGQLLEARFDYDDAVVHYDSITPGPGLNGGVINVSTSGDTIVVEMPDTNPLMDVGATVTVFTLHFGMETGDDVISTDIGIPYIERLNECGQHTIPHHLGNSINVEVHDAEADLGGVAYYTSATTYDVPVVLDSDVPINDFEFWVEFPADDISFVEVVAVAGFTEPGGEVDISDTTVVQVNSSLNTDYDPADLPATVFKLKFQKRHAMSVGDTMFVTFYDTQGNEVRYDMDSPFGYHTADLTLDDGFIRIKSRPVNTCPALYVWNGESYELDNTILAACDGANVTEDITEYYKIRKPVVADGGKLLFKINEEGNQVSTFRDFRIIAVDHDAKEPFHVKDDGTILTVGQPFAISWARDHKAEDITALVETRDDVPYESFESGYIDVSFGSFTAEQVSNFVALSQEIPKENEERDNLTASADDLENRNKKLKVYVQDADGEWEFIGEENARRNPGLQATSVASEYVEAGREFVLRYAWDEYYMVDVIDLRATEEFRGMTHSVSLVSAEHSKDGTLAERLGQEATAEPALLSPGETIELQFDISALPPFKVGTIREYIFVTTGRYTDVGSVEEETPELRFALENNYPNPFNPNTMIRYSLMNATNVSLHVYDVRGALVKTLVTGYQDAGKYTVDWDGTTDGGHRVSSGVYFYRIKTPEFTDTRKMVLLR
ncbi:MAG: T9SS type A sorting domain-containing protein [Candidatus Krumholzibacteria bacterium]|nr:T9SS type A sorting domain-containing protein [Candidatus Krumholzibacteria bacterium]